MTACNFAPQQEKVVEDPILSRYIDKDIQNKLTQDEISFYKSTIDFIDFQKDAQHWTRIRRDHVLPLLEPKYKELSAILTKTPEFTKITESLNSEGIGYYLIHVNNVNEITRERLANVLPFSKFEISASPTNDKTEKPDEGHLFIKTETGHTARVDFKLTQGTDVGINVSNRGIWRSE